MAGRTLNNFRQDEVLSRHGGIMHMGYSENVLLLPMAGREEF